MSATHAFAFGTKAFERLEAASSGGDGGGARRLRFDAPTVAAVPAVPVPAAATPVAFLSGTESHASAAPVALSGASAVHTHFIAPDNAFEKEAKLRSTITAMTAEQQLELAIDESLLEEAMRLSAESVA